MKKRSVSAERAQKRSSGPDVVKAGTSGAFARNVSRGTDGRVGASTEATSLDKGSLTFEAFESSCSFGASAGEEAQRPELLALLGLQRKAGELATMMRANLVNPAQPESYFRDDIGRAVGDTIWYAVALARHCGNGFRDLAFATMHRNRGRWPGAEASPTTLDADFPEHEQFPTNFNVEFVPVDSSKSSMRWVEGGRQLGDVIDD